MNQKRLHYLDFLRGIAALLVILEHAGQRLSSPGFNIDNFVSNWLSLGQVGVLIFFLLSGYIIPYSYENVSGHLGAFWISRAFRLYPLYFVVIAITMVVDLAVLKSPVPHLVLSLAAHIVFVQEWLGLHNFGGPSWTLFLELLWYLTFTFICLFRIKSYFWLSYAALIFSYVVIDVVSFFVHTHLPLGRIAYYYSFFIGYFAYLYRNERTLSGPQFVFCAAGLIGVIFLSLYVGFGLHPKKIVGEFYFSLRDVLLNWTIGLSIAGIVFWFDKVKYSQAFLYLGRISYSTYMIHSLVIAFFTSFTVNRIVYLPLVLAVTVVLSHFTYTYIERPFIRKGKAINDAILRDAVTA